MKKRKLKTKKLLLKRLKITKNGKVLRLQAFKRHLNSKKSSSKKRGLGKMIKLNSIYAKKVKKFLGTRK